MNTLDVDSKCLLLDKSKKDKLPGVGVGFAHAEKIFSLHRFSSTSQSCIGGGGWGYGVLSQMFRVNLMLAYRF